MVLTAFGKLDDKLDHPDAVISWPKCPSSYLCLREWGQDKLPLSDIIEWIVERGEHRAKNYPASASRVVREFLAIRDKPDILWKAFYAEKARIERGGK